jgi:hypothetical protein
MAEDQTPHRSRRSLLAAAAGGAAALAAQAALPLTAAAATGEPLELGTGNVATTATTLHQETADIDSFWSSGAGFGTGVQGSSTAGSGILGWSVTDEGSAPGADRASTGVYGWAPEGTGEVPGTGVWGDSADFGVYGTGYFGVYGYGAVGVTGQAATASSPAIRAVGATTSSPALQVSGKVSFNRSGRKLIGAGKTSVVVSLAGVTTGSKVFAVLATNRSGRYVRAVVPTTNAFTVYLNTSYTATSTIAWFVLD